MLHRKGRKSHTPTVVQCPEDQLREIIHMAGYSLFICAFALQITNGGIL